MKKKTEMVKNDLDDFNDSDDFEKAIKDYAQQLDETAAQERAEDSRKSFVFYRSFYEAISVLPDSDKLIVYENIAEYGLNGKMKTDLPNSVQAIIILIKPQIEANKARYINGKKGGVHGYKGGLLGGNGGRPKVQEVERDDFDDENKEFPD